MMKTFSSRSRKPKAVFYVPHPDDETLSMGGAIVNHLFAGNDVYVVLLSHGRASDAYNVLCGRVACSWHKKNHDPSLEGYAPFDLQKFGLARVREFLAACECLGVSLANTEIYDFEDGQVTVEQVKQVIMKWETRFPGSKHKTMTYHDKNPDHANAGRALLELYNEGVVKDARFYIKHSQMAQVAGAYEAYRRSYYPSIQAAAEVYKTWKPAQGKLAIGYHSVKNDFDQLLHNPQSKFHRPGQKHVGNG